jgi:hypothetical protein
MIAAVLGLLASSTSDSGGGWLLLLGPLGGGMVYFGLWRYYRNTDASHAFERETRIGVQPVTGSDSKVDRVSGTTRSMIDGDNRLDPRQRVQRF